MWRYQVTATLRDSDAVQQYLEWLFAGHVAEVCHWAKRAEVVHLTEQNLSKVMSVYWFSSREDFERYENEGAPALRSEGVKIASALGGISFERTLGWSWSMEMRG